MKTKTIFNIHWRSFSNEDNDWGNWYRFITDYFSLEAAKADIALSKANGMALNQKREFKIYEVVLTETLIHEE